MDKLSYEVISLIVGNIDGPLSPYSVVSRAWQSVVEARTFSRVLLESRSMDVLDSTFAPSQGRRRKNLKKLYFDVCLPKSNELRADYRKNLEVFRQAVTALFQRLAAWEETGRNLELTIGTSRIYTDEVPDNTLELEEMGYCGLDRSGTDDDRSPGGRRYLALRDTDLQAVPTVSCVNALVVGNPYGFSIHPTAGFLMARCFQGLQELSLSYYDPVKRRRALRREHRQAVADGVKSLHDLPRLRKLQIKCEHNRDPQDHGFEIQDFRDGQGVDALCEAIRCLAQAGKLAELDLEATLVSPDLFQDQRLPPGQREIPWPSLERFRICQGIVAPDGRWYATGDPAQSPTDSPISTYGSEASSVRMYAPDDPDVDSEDLSNDDGDDEYVDAPANGDAPDHRWRTRLDPDVFDPLALALAAAVLVMPKLKRGTVELGVDAGRGLLPYVLACAEPGQEMQWDEYIESAPATAQGRRWRAILHDGAGWEPSEELQGLWNAWVGPGGTAETVVFEEVDAYDPQYLWCHGSSWRHISRQ